MATYRSIKGYKVQSVASDPSPSPEGQVWYNTTGTVLKFTGLGAGSWGSGGLVNTARGHLAGAGSSQTAGLIFCGVIPGGATVAQTESYDGTTWTEVADLATPRAYFSGCGTQTAAITAGGALGPPTYAVMNETEIWNGTAWTEVGNLNTARERVTNTGTVTAALTIGGRVPGSGTARNSALTEDYNGTSWTEVGDLTTARYSGAGASSGTPTAALLFGGNKLPDPPYGATETESYNGTAWTELADLGTARYGLGGVGTQTDALAFGGSFPDKTETEAWDGTAWTEVADLAVARASGGGFGGPTSAVWAAGNSTAPKNASEEWTRAATTLTVTTS